MVKIDKSTGLLLSIVTFGILFVVFVKCFVVGQTPKAEPRVVLSDTLVCMSAVVEPDSVMQKKIDVFRDSIAVMMSEKLCYCRKELVASRPENGLNRVVSDLLLNETRAYAKANNLPLPDLALCNVGGLRSSIHVGDVSIQDVYEVLPFQNAAVIIELDGIGLQRCLDHVAIRMGEAVSGVTFSINNGTAQHIRVRNKALVDNKTYYLATIDYLAEGGDSFNMFDLDKITYTHLLLRDLMIEHFRCLRSEGRELTDPADNRISISHILP